MNTVFDLLEEKESLKLKVKENQFKINKYYKNLRIEIETLIFEFFESDDAIHFGRFLIYSHCLIKQNKNESNKLNVGLCFDYEEFILDPLNKRYLINEESIENALKNTALIDFIQKLENLYLIKIELLEY